MKLSKELEWFQEKLWTTRNGNRLVIKNISLDHLKNICRFLKRKRDSLKETFLDYPSFQGEMAQIHAEYCWRETQKEFERVQEVYRLLKKYYKIKKNHYEKK